MPDQTGPDRLIVVGVISGAHGVRGDVRVKSFTDAPEAVFELGPLLGAQGQPMLSASRVKPGNDHFIVTPKTARQKEEWDKLKGQLLHVPRSVLPPPGDDEFYIEDLVGLAVEDAITGPVGTVSSVQNFGAGDLLEITPEEDRQPAFFVPFTLEDVPSVSFERRAVTLADAQLWADQSDPRKQDAD